MDLEITSSAGANLVKDDDIQERSEEKELGRLFFAL
jgi:hypothetical protein